MIFSDYTGVTGMKNRKWCEGYFDIAMGDTAYGQLSGTETVVSDSFIRAAKYKAR